MLSLDIFPVLRSARPPSARPRIHLISQFTSCPFRRFEILDILIREADAREVEPLAPCVEDEVVLRRPRPPWPTGVAAPDRQAPASRAAARRCWRSPRMRPWSCLDSL